MDMVQSHRVMKLFLEPMLTMVISHCRLKVQKSVYSELLKTEV